MGLEPTASPVLSRGGLPLPTEPNLLRNQLLGRTPVAHTHCRIRFTIAVPFAVHSSDHIPLIELNPLARAGFEPAASPGLSRSGLPVAYRAD